MNQIRFIFLKVLVLFRRYCINIFWQVFFIPISMRAWFADLKGRSFYKEATEFDLHEKRKSDTVFICGTGYSITSIPPEKWRVIEKHDVLSFRCFPKQKFVKVGFHVIGEIDDIEEYADDINKNPMYDQSIFLVQEGFRARKANHLIGEKKLRISAPLFRFKRKDRGIMAPLSKNFSAGVVHGFGSVCEAINVAYIIGWKRIVLVGIDLYDHRHFYHPPDKLRDVEKSGIILDEPYTTSAGIVELVGMWSEALASEGREIFIHNRHSLLSKILPIFEWKCLSDINHDADFYVKR